VIEYPRAMIGFPRPMTGSLRAMIGFPRLVTGSLRAMIALLRAGPVSQR